MLQNLHGRSINGNFVTVTQNNQSPTKGLITIRGNTYRVCAEKNGDFSVTKRKRDILKSVTEQSNPPHGSTSTKLKLLLKLVNCNKADVGALVFKNADLSGMDLSGLDLRYVDFTGANLSNANLSNADLSNANLTGANLSGTDMSNTILNGATLVQIIGEPLNIVEKEIPAPEIFVPFQENSISDDPPIVLNIPLSGANSHAIDLLEKIVHPLFAQDNFYKQLFENNDSAQALSPIPRTATLEEDSFVIPVSQNIQGSEPNRLTDEEMFNCKKELAQVEEQLGQVLAQSSELQNQIKEDRNRATELANKIAEKQASQGHVKSELRTFETAITYINKSMPLPADFIKNYYSARIGSVNLIEIETLTMDRFNTLKSRSGDISRRLQEEIDKTDREHSALQEKISQQERENDLLTGRCDFLQNEQYRLKTKIAGDSIESPLKPKDTTDNK
jgi:hypothetical protein